MPFDPAPAPKTEVGQFQRLADAMLRGCALRPVQCTRNYFEGDDAACAIGALIVGLTGRTDFCGLDGEEVTPMELSYFQRYGTSIPADNDRRGFTREEIAARIAAL